MRIAIISDIHGNYPALVNVLEKIDQLKCDGIYSLGDVCGYYCMVNECIEELRKRNIVNILGNHDYYLVYNVNCPRSNSANDCIKYQRHIISENNYAYIKKSRKYLYLNDNRISLVHGGWNNFLEEYIENIEHGYFKDLEGSFFLSGHTHIQQVKTFNDKTYCNPGSVGQPRDGDRRAAFCVIDENKINTFRVEYDIDKIVFQMEYNGFSDYYYSNLYYGQKIGYDKQLLQ